MPTEYYFGIVIGVILLILLGLLLKPGLGTRRAVRRESNDTKQMAHQLSRIADSLEKLVAHLGAVHLEASPLAEKPAVPLQKGLERSDTGEKQIEQPSASEPRVGEPQVEQPSESEPHAKEPHVTLSMFGR
jgi:hypothetical protein